MSASQPFVPTTTVNIERANRLMSLKANPGWWDLIKLSQELVDGAQSTSTDFGGWDPQQIIMLKCRAQAAKEHHQLLLARINDAIQSGIDEARSTFSTLPVKTAEEIVEQGDLVRQEVLKRFEDMVNRVAGSYNPES